MKRATWFVPGISTFSSSASAQAKGQEWNARLGRIAETLSFSLQIGLRFLFSAAEIELFGSTFRHVAFHKGGACIRWYSQLCKAIRPVVRGVPRRCFETSWVILLFIGTIAMSGCSVRKFAINKLGDSLANSGTTFASDNDPEFVGQAIPFSLKLIDGLLAESPKHKGMLLAATSGYTQYSYVYVQESAEEIETEDVTKSYALGDRARNLYLRARDYGLRGLETKHRGFSALLRENPRAAVQGAKAQDVPLLYWTAVAWGAAIALSKDHPALVAEQPQMEALQKFGDRKYRLIQKVGDSDRSNKEAFDVCVAHLGGYLFFDATFQTVGPDGKTVLGEDDNFFWIPLHLIGRLDVVGNALHFRLLDDGWLQEELKSGRLHLTCSQDDEGGYLLTAPSKELKQFAARFAADPKAFSYPEDFDRVPREEAIRPSLHSFSRTEVQRDANR